MAMQLLSRIGQKHRIGPLVDCFTAYKILEFQRVQQSRDGWRRTPQLLRDDTLRDRLTLLSPEKLQHIELFS